MLDRRLLKCSEMVSEKGTVCDVGTDHANLPVYLIKNKLCSHVIASDIADGPLEAAHKNISQAGLEDRISVVRSDGLKEICPDNITNVIIAGMGAETMSHIIEDAPWLHNNVNLILQPMTKSAYMRKWLYENGFRIIKEEAVKDENHIYTVINAVYTGNKFNIPNLMAYGGKLDYKKPESIFYASHEAAKLAKMSKGMKKSDSQSSLADKLDTIGSKLLSLSQGNGIFTVGDIYDMINRHAAFSTQESYDNCGLLAGKKDKHVSRVLVSLDITNEVADEAVKCSADLVVSHHPVIFHALKNLNPDLPAVRLAANNIAAICVHTPLDMAKGGINDIIVKMLAKEFVLTGTNIPLEPYSADRSIGIGRIVQLKTETDSDTLAGILKRMFGCAVVRYTKKKGTVKKIALCSGSGGSLISEVLDAGCDAYITGDVKHDVFIDAANNNLALYDCGHYYTENIAVSYLCQMIEAATNGVEVTEAESNKDVTSYI